MAFRYKVARLRSWGILLAILVLLAGFATWRTAARMMGMKNGTAAVDVAEFESLAVGQSVKAVLEVVDAQPPGTIRGRLLEKEDETHYKRSETAVEAIAGQNTRFVMGSDSDIKPGAIVHVKGTVTAGRSIQAEQIVILTEYVQVR